MKVLVCPPTYFDVTYEINPWMNVADKPNKDLAFQQFNSLMDIYKKIGIEVLTIPQDSKLPDMVYPANDGFIENGRFVKANYKFDERKKESDLAADYFKKLGYEIVTIPENISWEGEGDFLKIGNRYFLGWGKRSDSDSKKYLEEIFDTKIIDFELINPYYYHLDTCFAPLRDDLVMINPKSFTEDGIKLIHENFDKVIESNEMDNDFLACNMVINDNQIVVGKGITESTKNKLIDEGFVIHENDMSEYLKGGGSVKCCTLVIRD